jgi:hypothetical protein
MPAVADKSQAIALAAMAALEGRLPVERRPNFCLRFARQVVEHALGLPPQGFYRLIEEGFTPEGRGRAYASDVEAAVRKLGWAVSPAQLRPGDLLFSGRASPRDPRGVYYGHVGVYVGNGQVAENTAARRGRRYGGALALTPLSAWDPITTAARLP